MPELPDVTVYVERLQHSVRGKRIERVRVGSPFVVRTYEPPMSSAAERRVLDVSRLGKRIVFTLEGDVFLVIHLMIAGRLRWREPGAALPRKLGLLAIDFSHGTLLLTEAGTKRRASVHLVRSEGLRELDRGGLEPLEATVEAFAGALRRENRTLKRTLTDPRIFSGIGNAYSDEILHDAKLSPVQRTLQLDDQEIERLYDATRKTLVHWIERLRAEVGEGFPEKVTAFREGMAVHGRFRKPCPVCGTLVQRIRYEANEVNYCPRCQTEGRVLADRSLSRLLRGDWPRSIEELEELEATRGARGPV